MLASLTQDNWIALHEAVASAMPEGRYFDVSIEDGRIVLTPVPLSDAEIAHERLPELVQTARNWLAAADREFDAERDLAAARCLWEAVRAAVTAVSVKRGNPIETDADMFALVVALDKEDGGDYKHLVRFGVAQSLNDQINEPGPRCSTRDDFDFEVARRATKGLVDYLTGLSTTVASP